MVLNVEASAGTDIGLVRRNNQDAHGSDEELGLYVVCDGMGGAAGGDVASALAAETFLRVARKELAQAAKPSIQSSQLAVRRAVEAANRAVVKSAERDPRLRGMGSTLVAIRLEGDDLTIANVGDSRAYLLREGHLTQLTLDHSYVTEQVGLGLMTAEEAEHSTMHALITRAIGAEGEVNADIFQANVQAGDTILLATDGLTRHIADDDIAALLAAPHGNEQEASPAEACRVLIDAAKKAGGSDNITCFVLRVTHG